MSMPVRFLSAAFLLLVTSLPAAAQLPVSLRVSAVGATQAAELSASVDGNEVGSESASVNALGAEAMLGFAGAQVGAYYLRHFGDLGSGTDPGGSWGMSANELGLQVEKHFVLLPLSPLAPSLGAGASWGRITLGDEITVPDRPDVEVEGSLNVYRIYGLAALQLTGSLGAKLRAGWTFGSIDGDDLQLSETVATPGGDASYELTYDGLFLALSVSVFGF